MRKLLLTAIALVCLTACGGDTAVSAEYSKNGVSFTVPEKWKITEEEDLDPTGHYLSLERAGLNESGIITVSWLSSAGGILTREDMMDNTLEVMESMELCKDLVVTEVPDAMFGTYPALCQNYTMNVMGAPHRGRLYAMEYDGKIMCVMMQEMPEDNSKNKDGFKTFEESFSVGKKAVSDEGSDSAEDTADDDTSAESANDTEASAE